MTKHKNASQYWYCIEGPSHIDKSEALNANLRQLEFTSRTGMKCKPNPTDMRSMVAHYLNICQF